MRYIIASDIHGSIKYANKLMEVVKEARPEKLILLGDLYYHGPRNPLPEEYNPKAVSELFNSIKEDLIVVKGNCDAEVDEMISEFSFETEYKMNIEGKKLLFTHGHKINKDNLPDNVDILIYGHFHTGFIEEHDGIICMNPGSTTLPKNNTPNSYGIIENGQLKVVDFSGNIICERAFL